MKALPDWRGWLVLATVACLLGWFAAPVPEPSASLVKARRDDWSLAALPRRYEQAGLAGVVLSATYWGAGLPAGGVVAEPPPPDMRWRIAAVFGRGSEAGVLILFEDPAKLPLRLRVGEALPSGHKIDSISERDVCVRVGKKVYRLGVERREQ